MALPQNRKAVLGILEEISPRVIGATKEGFSCAGGLINHGPTFVKSIYPSGDVRPGTENEWIFWDVQMAHDQKQRGYDYSTCLNEFIPSEELDAIFSRHFGNYRTQEPYKLQICGGLRCDLRLPPAVRIRENVRQVCFYFDWGIEQEAAEEIEEIFIKTPDRIDKADDYFPRIIFMLEHVVPLVYPGGPAPELPFESEWPLDYDKTLADAVLKANSLIIRNMSCGYRNDKKYYDQVDVVFDKE